MEGENKSGRSTDQNAVKEERNRQKKYIRNKRLITVGRRVVNRILEKKGSSIRISSANEAVAQYALAKKVCQRCFSLILRSKNSKWIYR